MAGKNEIEMDSTYNEGNEGKFFVVETKRIKFINLWLQYEKNVYSGKLDDIVHKYNNTYHKTTKMKPLNVKQSAYIDSSKEINDKDHKFKINDFLEYQNIKTFLQKALFQIGLKEFLLSKKLLKTLLLVILKAKKLPGRFMKKNFKKQIKKSLELKK